MQWTRLRGQQKILNPTINNCRYSIYKLEKRFTRLHLHDNVRCNETLRGAKVKIIQRLPLAIILIFWTFNLAQAQPSLEKLWLTEGLKVPESVLYYHDEKSSYLLVSQIDGDAVGVDGKGGIAKMTESGELLAPDWVTGLNAPKGMAVFEGKLYVADINEIVVINIKKAKVEKKIPVAGSLFLNDVAIDKQGVVFVSDTRTNKIYRIQGVAVDIYLDKVDGANGLKFVGNNLAVGAGTHLLLVDSNKTRLPLASGFGQPIDGIESLGRDGFIVSCWAGLIYYVDINGHLDLLLDTQQTKINAADIGYDKETKTVYVPNFAKNSVTAYRLKIK